MPRLTLPNHAQTRCKNREGKACITHEGRRCAPCPAILPDKQETQTSTHTNTFSQSLMEVNDDGQPSRFRCMRLTNHCLSHSLMRKGDTRGMDARSVAARQWPLP